MVLYRKVRPEAAKAMAAALLALTLSLAGCGPVDGDPIRSGAAASDSAPRPDAVTVAQLRQQAETKREDEAVFLV